MILLVSEENEFSTDKVIDWIYYLGKSFYRFNGEVMVRSNGPISIELGNQRVRIKNSTGIEVNISQNEIKAIWYRRPSFSNIPEDYLSGISKEGFYGSIQRTMLGEYLDCS